MEISFDPDKDEGNQKKHGVSLGEAAKFDWDAVELRLDTFDEYGEAREIGYGFIGERVYCVVLVQRGQVLRIISLRRATKSEALSYERKFLAK